ncbi:protein FAR1-RELATED SEQUENCE 5-like [Capsicum annuum]
MLQKYDLEDNNWLKNTFAIREKWSMTYGRNTFSAGMRSTQLSESFNASLRGYLKSDLDIVQFFKYFQRSVDDKRVNENKSNFDMTQKIPNLKVKLPLRIHAREVYTPTIFDIFQNEWERSLLISIKDCYDEGEVCTYSVSSLGSVKKHVVTVKRHALKIPYILNIKDMIHVHYILKRWTKDATNINEMDASLVEKDIDPKVEVTTRYRHLCHTFVQISSEALESKEGYELAVKGANEIIFKLKDIKRMNESAEKLATSNSIQNELSEIIFIDNTTSQSKQLDDLPNLRVSRPSLSNTSNAMPHRMSRERAKHAALPPAQENIEKLEKVVKQGNYYGAQQMFKSISARYVSSERYSEALKICCLIFVLNVSSVVCAFSQKFLWISSVVVLVQQYNDRFFC